MSFIKNLERRTMDNSFNYSYTADATSTGLWAGIGLVWTLIWMAVGLLVIISQWKIFTKAGKPGWAAIIPIYNLIVLLEIIGKPLWWIVLLLIPFVNIVIYIIMALELGKVFGKSGGWSFVFLILLSPIGYPWLAFGKDQYQAPAAPAQ